MGATFSNMFGGVGTDSRATSGSDMELPSRSIQLHPEVKRSADLSECLRSLDSQDHSVLRDFQDARSEQERAQSSTCGKIERHADSLEEDSQCRSAASVRLASHISGLESSDASRSELVDLPSGTEAKRKKSSQAELSTT